MPKAIKKLFLDVLKVKRDDRLRISYASHTHDKQYLRAKGLLPFKIHRSPPKTRYTDVNVAHLFKNAFLETYLF